MKQPPHGFCVHVARGRLMSWGVEGRDEARWRERQEWSSEGSQTMGVGLLEIW